MKKHMQRQLQQQQQKKIATAAKEDTGNEAKEK
jgi:hypothetical protein